MSDNSQGIVRTGRGEEQPADKERARKAVQSDPAKQGDKKPGKNG
jgi:hypothetical protein